MATRASNRAATGAVSAAGSWRCQGHSPLLIQAARSSAGASSRSAAGLHGRSGSEPMARPSGPAIVAISHQVGRRSSRTSVGATGRFRVAGGRDISQPPIPASRHPTKTPSTAGLAAASKAPAPTTASPTGGDGGRSGGGAARNRRATATSSDPRPAIAMTAINRAPVGAAMT
jgi:hypothetical protein